MKTIDCRGLNCPQPLITTKKELERLESDAMVTIVDNEVAKNNISKFLNSQGYTFEVKEENGDYHLTVSNKGNENVPSTEPKAKSPKVESDKLVIALGTDKYGEGDEELGKLLMRSYMFTLTESDNKPTDMIFFNSGVKLTTEDSDVIDHLKELEKNGTNILVCGTCLDFYNVKEKLAVGEISNMYSIVETMNGEGKVIKL